MVLIDWGKAATYMLTVNSGSGDGSYTQGHVVNISADAAPSGQEFNVWIGDTSGIASVTSANTTITMPPSNATITATYQATGGAYNISVVGGSPSGSYNVGDTVYITASGGAPDANELFTWSGNVGALAAEDVTNWDTSFVIPSAWPVGYYDPWTITANYVANDNPGIKTDYNIYPEPPLPTLPAAGGKFTDPVFGTTIMRVTDELSGNDNHSAIFTQFQVFNADTTRFFVLSDGVPKLYDLNKTAFTISNKRNLFTSTGPGLRVWDINWDTSNPDVVYGHTGVKIYSYNVATDTYTLVVDLASMLGSIPGAANMSFMHSDDYSDRFAFMVQDSGWAYVGSAVYDKSQNQVIYQGTQIPHDSTMDKSGKWFATTPEGEPGGITLRVVEMARAF